MAKETSYYYDFNYSLPLVQLILRMLGKSEDPSQNQLNADYSREWFSQPRVGSSSDTECITVSFRLPLSVSEISTEIIRMPCNVELWYQDRSNNWRPILNSQRSPLKVRIDRSDTKSWYKWVTQCYPIVAKKVQIRFTRYNDGVLDAIPYPVGARNTLIRRNVYDRSHGGFFEEGMDIMGNTVSRYVRDWSASQAADDNYVTFWKSAPQPDPAAVVSLFLDVRDEQGGSQVIDRVFIDPVYSGQHLNLYYSSDSTVGSRNISPITLAPPEDDEAVVNIDWKFDRGLADTADGNEESRYSWPMGVGPLIGQDAWIGVDWRPSFSSFDDPNLSQNPILFAAGDPTGQAAKPVLSYDPSSRTFTLQFFNKPGGSAVAASGSYTTGSISEEWTARDSIKIVAGWRYGDTDSVSLKVIDSRSRIIASYDQETSSLPSLVSFDGNAQVSNFRGTIANLVVKLESHTVSSEAFLSNPSYYCDPDPVIADKNNNYPSTTLDNAIYTAPFLTREHGSGGSDKSHFEDKEWTPIWRDYVAVKGMLHFPNPIPMQYLKLEFTNLTEQPYPIYDSGIETKYKVFPLSVTQSSSLGPKLYTGKGGFLGLGTFVSMNGVRSVNWLDPTSVMKAIGAMATPQIPPVIINAGTPYLSDSLPNDGFSQLERTRRVEMASSYVYARDAIQPYVLAQDQYNTIVKAEGLQAVQPYVDVPWKDIQAANPDAVTKVKSTGTVPIRGTDWWIYPGQQLKVPASVMRKITDTDTVTERKLTLETRYRFNNTSVHRYEWRTVKRDAAIAYFAGLREVQPYKSRYIAGEDVATYRFPSYTADRWEFTNIRQDPSGPVTTSSPSLLGVLTSQEMVSQSDFSKVTLEFQDSGLTKSNSMWVDIDQNTDSIDDTQLSPYFGVIPTDIPKGTWADALSKWSDPETVWGSSYSLVSINVDNDRRYQRKRVVHFTREGGQQGEAGISLDQWTNFTPGAKFRIGAVFYRPLATTNDIILRLKRGDGTILIEETLASVPVTESLESLDAQQRNMGYAPSGRWFEASTAFAEIPETLSNASFDNSLVGWIPQGGSWSAVSDKGYTGLKSARLTTNGSTSKLTSEKMDCVVGATASASAWVTWSGITPGHAIYLNAVFYNQSGGVVSTVALGNQATPASSSSLSWSPISGSTVIPTGQGVSQMAFQVVIPSGAGSGGSVWVDDFTTSVPGAPRQQFTAELTVSGDQQEELYVSDLYTETTPIRYYVRMGPPGTTPIEVTDLRYTRSRAIVTSTNPVNQMQVQTVITSDRAYAFGCTVTPHYLK